MSEKKVNFYSEHAKCSFSTTLKIYCSKTEGMKNIVTLFPEIISHKTFLWTGIMQSWQPWQKVFTQNPIVYHWKSKLFFLYFQIFSSKTSSGSVEDSLTALLRVFGTNLLKNFNLIEFVRKLFSQMVQLWICNKTFWSSWRNFLVKSRRFS